jgi:UDP-glucose 4-epimerase
MRILVIGSSGFIGANALKYFSQKGYTVDGVDVVAGINDSLANKTFVTPPFDFSAIEEIVKAGRYNSVVNCAGSASVPFSFQDPYTDYELNTRIVFQLLCAIHQYSKETRFINLSSAAVYGNPAQLPIKEEDTIQPISPYGNHKQMSEIICRQFAAHFGVTTCALRIFSAYGEGLKKQLFWDLQKKAKVAQSVELFGDGTESRDFIHIDDVMQAIHCVVNHQQANSGFTVFNVANGAEESINSVASLFLKHYAPNVAVKFIGQAKEGDPKNWRADITKLSQIGYKRTVSMEEGIIRYAEWLKATE